MGDGPTYLSQHPRGGWRYQRFIPSDLRPLLGGRQMHVKYIRAMKRQDALKEARRLATQDDRSWDALRQLSPQERAQLAAHGGLDGLKQTVAGLEEEIATFRRIYNSARAMEPSTPQFAHLAGEPALLDQLG